MYALLELFYNNVYVYVRARARACLCVCVQSIYSICINIGCVLYVIGIVHVGI